MSSRRPLLVLVAGAAATAVLAGCGSGGNSSLPKDPKGELSKSVTNLADTDALTTTLKLETTAAALEALAKSGGDTLDPKTAQAIASAQLVFESRSDNGTKLSKAKASDAKHMQSRILATDGGKNLVEIRSLSDTVYLQADVQSILGVANQSNAYGELQARAATLPAFAKAAVNGQWISLDANKAKGLASQFGGGGQTPNAQQQQALLADLKGVLDRDVTVTKAGTDSDKGDHLVLKGEARKLVTDIVSAVSSEVPGGSTLAKQLKPGDVDNRTVTVDAWVKDGKLSELSLDTVQFSNPSDKVPAGTHLPVTLTFEQKGDNVDKPAQSTPVDFSQLLPLLGALQGS